MYTESCSISCEGNALRSARMFSSGRGSFLALFAAEHAGGAACTLRRKLGPRPGSVTRAPGIQSCGELALFAGSLSAEPEPSRTTETHTNNSTVGLCMFYRVSQLAPCLVAWPPRTSALPARNKQQSRFELLLVQRCFFSCIHGCNWFCSLLWTPSSKVDLLIQVDQGFFMFGLAATSSHIAHNLGITAAAAAAHTPKTSFESQKHPRTIQRNSSGKTAAAATRTSGHPHRRNACVPCSGVLQFNHIPKGNLAQQMLPVYFIFPSILYTYIGASTTLRTPSTLKYSEETADKTSKAGGSVSQLSTLSSPVF